MYRLVIKKYQLSLPDRVTSLGVCPHSLCVSITQFCVRLRTTVFFASLETVLTFGQTMLCPRTQTKNKRLTNVSLLFLLDSGKRYEISCCERSEPHFRTVTTHLKKKKASKTQEYKKALIRVLFVFSPKSEPSICP